MKREQKYPDTATFKFFNANPKNRFTGDCVIRAIVTALEQDYNNTVMEMAELMCKTGYAMDSEKGIEKYLTLKGWTKHPQPRKSDNTKYTGEEFCKLINKDILFLGKRIIANIGSHHIVCIKQTEDVYGMFKVHDTWDSTDGCIGNFWIKE